MDLKGSLVSTEIKIKPSTKLVKYLKTLNIDDTTENVSKVINEKYYELVKTNKESTPLTEDNRVNFELTEKEDALISKIQPSEKKINNELNDEEYDEIICSILLTIKDIEHIFEILNKERSKEENVPYLHELLEGSKIILPPNEIVKRNPELEARCVKLRAQQEAREYRAMTKSVDNVRMWFPEDSISYQLKHLNRQLIAIGQFILSLFAGFLFGFLGVELIVGHLDFGFRLLLGVMCALIIALAEIYFLAKKLNEEMAIPETVQLGGPPKFTNEQRAVSDKKCHQD